MYTSEDTPTKAFRPEDAVYYKGIRNAAHAALLKQGERLLSLEEIDRISKDPDYVLTIPDTLSHSRGSQKPIFFINKDIMGTGYRYEQADRIGISPGTVTVILENKPVTSTIVNRIRNKTDLTINEIITGTVGE